jgi:hypothetical protein
MRQNPKSTREFIKSDRARSTHQSPPTEEQIDPSGRMDLRSMKLKKVQYLRRQRRGRRDRWAADDGGDVLYRIGEPGLGLDLLMSHL